jgi:hypothetical protein
MGSGNCRNPWFGVSVIYADYFHGIDCMAARILHHPVGSRICLPTASAGPPIAPASELLITAMGRETATSSFVNQRPARRRYPKVSRAPQSALLGLLSAVGGVALAYGGIHLLQVMFRRTRSLRNRWWT